jgi:hypothetical protein
MVVHIGDLCYANGYLSQWDQFTAQIEPIASTIPYMIGMYVNYVFLLICFFYLIYLRFGGFATMKPLVILLVSNRVGFDLVHGI